MRHLVIPLSVGPWLLLAAPLFGDSGGPVISVGIFSAQRIPACTIASTGRMEVAGTGVPAVQPGGTIGLVADGEKVVVSWEETGGRAQCCPPSPVTVTATAPLKVTPGGIKARAYRGLLVITAKEGRLTLVNRLPLEEYLRGVVPAEVPSSFAPEAVKAQAIAARTYAVVSAGKHGAGGYDLCDGTHCQVYLGVEGEDPGVDAALRETAGQIVTYQGRPISAVYHDTCGGCTAGNEEVWASGPSSYLRPVSDRWDVFALCAASPRARWTYRISQEQLVAALASLGVTGLVTLIAPEGCEDGTRPERYRVTGEKGEWRVRASAMRDLVNRSLGRVALLSPYFAAQVEGDEVTIMGWGSGHGVGLCQWGANALAKAGWTAAQILQRYYAGTRVEHP